MLLASVSDSVAISACKSTTFFRPVQILGKWLRIIPLFW